MVIPSVKLTHIYILATGVRLTHIYIASVRLTHTWVTTVRLTHSYTRYRLRGLLTFTLPL